MFLCIHRIGDDFYKSRASVTAVTYYGGVLAIIGMRQAVLRGYQHSDRKAPDMLKYKINIPASIFAILWSFAMIFSNAAFAGDVKLAWDYNSTPAPAGYLVHYGRVSGSYTATVDTGTTPTCTPAACKVSGLLPGKYYFAVSAYDANKVEGPLSAELPVVIRVPDGSVYADYPGSAEISVRRASTGVWFTISSSIPNTLYLTTWGQSTDIPVTGDYDGDKKTDIAVWRPSTGFWWTVPSGSPGTYTAAQWGTSTDTPVPGDYDGDGKTDIAVWRPSNGFWWILPSGGGSGTYTATQWGMSGDVPVPGDYDGDGKTDIAVWRPSTGFWWILPSGSPGTYLKIQWGLSGDIPVPGDYDGDGKIDIAVWRPSNSFWWILPSGSSGTYVITQWGMSTDIPVPGDYDGDGKTDIAVWRPSQGNWWQLPSGTPGTYAVTQWGTSTDTPISSATRILNITGH